MLRTVHSATLLGLEVVPVRVEVAITRGTPVIQVVGLPESAIREGRDRIRAAANHLGLHVPGRRITVNLAPADVRKHGSAFDLPILVGILAADGEVPAERAGQYALVGELGLDGSVRPVRGVLPVALHFQGARKGERRRERGEPRVGGLLVPRANLAEARPATRLDVRGAATLSEVLAFLKGEAALPGPADVEAVPGVGAGEEPDLADVRGQETAKRALEIAAAGGHNLLLRGEPGCGKTMLARRLPTLLPPLGEEEAVQVTALHSVAGALPTGAGLVRRPPFRAPHHTTSETGLVGGGRIPRPGEVSLAHRGVLFLDELPEFSRSALEVLRQPLEEGRVTVVRVRATATFPARFALLAAMNPCPCGYHGSRAQPERCTCQPADVRRYLRRISGPLLDRIDLRLDLTAVPWSELWEHPKGEGSAAVRARVVEARARAAARWRRVRGAAGRDGRGGNGRARPRSWRTAGEPPRLNAELTPEEVRRCCSPDPAGETLLERAVDRWGLTARGCHRVLRVARTIADLAGADRVAAAHVAEALRYRVEG